MELTDAQVKFNKVFGPKVNTIFEKLDEMDRQKHKGYLDYSAVPAMRQQLLNRVNEVCDALESEPEGIVAGSTSINFFDLEAEATDEAAE